MIEYDALFWNRYYEWAVASPSQRIIGRMVANLEEFQTTLREAFMPAVRGATWAILGLELEFRLWDEPRWKRPFLRLVFHVRRLVASL